MTQGLLLNTGTARTWRISLVVQLTHEISENSPCGTAESFGSVRRKFESGATKSKLDSPITGRSIDCSGKPLDVMLCD